MVPKSETTTKAKRLMRGLVVSDKMNKTIVVSVENPTIHSRYAKVVRETKKYKVHDEQELAKTGDIVEIYEGRPVSKEKFMYLARVIESRKERE